ncbi:hypothetical protein [Anaerostipes sp.]|uniref:hypothetical protein n=1 Tax=Anaerostipes sp. TaxID=1872530 RepID=UPI003FF0A474
MKQIHRIKLVLGIFSISCAILFLIYTSSTNHHPFDFRNHPGGTTPFLIAGCFFLAGIISIITRKKNCLDDTNIIYAGSFTSSMFYFTAAILGYQYSGHSQGFDFWSVLSLLLGMIFVFLIKFSPRATSTP